MIVLLIEHSEEMMNDDHDRNQDVICTCQQCDDTFETVRSIKLLGEATTHTKTTRTATGDTLTVKELLQTQASHWEC